jgi:hypothetical protein
VVVDAWVTVSVNVQVPMSPAVSLSVPDTVYTPSGVEAGAVIAPAALTLTCGDVAAVA